MSDNDIQTEKDFMKCNQTYPQGSKKIRGKIDCRSRFSLRVTETYKNLFSIDWKLIVMSFSFMIISLLRLTD